jgi:uncharacterized protein YutE (UPF0331/DUF86 family)
MSREELIAALERDLQDVERYSREVSYDLFIKDRDTQNMVLFAVYRVSQDVVDLANAVIASRGLGVPRSYRDAFRLLAEAGMIDADLAGALEGWAGLRNVIAHIYRKLDLDQVFDACSKEIGTLRAFLASMRARAVDSEEP